MKTPLSACLFLLLCIIPLPGLAENFPEANPPRLELGAASTFKSQYLPDTGIPSAEWTFHKTVDGAHPDGNEQQFMWLMNRARANPTQEGVWLATMDDPDVAAARKYFNVDLGLLREEFAAITVRPPAAFDVRLYNAAKAHST
jgi:hypothetical protein